MTPFGELPSASLDYETVKILRLSGTLATLIPLANLYRMITKA